MSLITRSYEKELLDNDNIPYSDLQTNLRELDFLNTYLGGHHITCKGIDFFLNRVPPSQPLVIAEIGCGGGDNLFAIQKHLEKRRRKSKLIGVDKKNDCIAHAQQKPGSDIEWICSDYRDVKWPAEKPDIIFSSLFCHHFTNDELVTQLQWLKQNSRIGFFINDLHRHPVAYHFIRIMTQLFSKSYLVKNDAPLSVKRSFRKKDWLTILPAAEIAKHNIKWQWAFRYLICVEND
jgi:2-polyprenyl-3-methyl-5-hydroxy-6-metoxy-1,4-benzoquinol methylase